ncbi:Uma2 family endonuclease [Candidatus Viridilinea mediisalina]|uniref:Putative restriction endonuclease domain-containing protein n=1 Tax=Candidatus Viridilinea mediisalina TaxID=2024553 RepID=A0A2A6RPB9_9CHLR|nr:Uma2 family endonuclease [Candidatus Viridilinea mediisalina]PDW04793.1 hypothetical protein CJ255_01755 [Candidatus Viridilinea mediisalina]
MAILVVTTDAPLVEGPSQGAWTFADWERLPADGRRYEVIGGVLYMTTAPSSFHQWIVRRLERLVGIPAEDARLAYCFPAPIGVLMPACHPVQPDYVVVRFGREALFRAGRIYGVPDLLFEILSAASRSYDERIKLAAYATAGVPEYAIIDPRERSLNLYCLVAPGAYAAPRCFTAGDHVAFACLPGLLLPVAELFAGAPDSSL